MDARRRLGAAVGAVVVVATVSVGADRVNTADRLADRQLREARSLVVDAGAAANDSTGPAAVGEARRRGETGMDAHGVSADDAAATVGACRGRGGCWAGGAGRVEPCSASALRRWWEDSSSPTGQLGERDVVVVGAGVGIDHAGSCWFQVVFGA